MEMTAEQVNQAIDKKVNDTLAPIKTQLNDLVTKVGAIDGLGTEVKNLTESIAALEIGKGGAKKEDKGKTDPAAAATALTPEAVSKLVSDGIAAALKERDTTSAATAQQQADLAAFIEKNAPKLKGNPLAKRLFAGAKNDDERKAILAEYVDSVKATGAKPPDLGATAAGEGGATASADTAEAKKAAALEAAGKLKATVL